MSDIDWSKAPEGATHYNPDCVYPWLCATPAAYFIDGKGWIDYAEPAHAKRALDGAVPRPKLPDAAIVFDQKDPDAAATVEFAQAMVRRLAQCRDAGRSGWDDPEQCPIARLAEGAVRSLRNGELIDAANYLMMFWKRAQMARQEQCVPSWLDEARRSDAAQHLGKPVEWDGTGLPPVGTVCETLATASSQSGRTVRVLAHGTTHLFVRDLDKADEVLLFREEGRVWRPILTPEQRAAKERDEAVAAMLDSSGLSAYDNVTVQQVCEALHAAGYRKTEGE